MSPMRRPMSPLASAIDNYGSPPQMYRPMLLPAPNSADEGGPQILSPGDVASFRESIGHPRSPQQLAAMAAADEERRRMGYESASGEALSRAANPWIGYDF